MRIWSLACSFGLALALGLGPAAAQDRRAPDLRAPAMPNFTSLAGPYVAGGLSYGTTSQRGFSLTDGFACPQATIPGLGPVMLDGITGCNTSAALGGISAHAIVGFNFSGDQAWVSGVELRGRIGREGGAGRLGGATNVTLAGIPVYRNEATGAYRADLDGGLALTGRIGYNINGFLPFLRAGFGVARLTESVSFDATNARVCTLTNQLNNPVTCVTGGRLADGRSTYLPSAIVGAGLEIPFGRFFARIDGEVEAVFSPSQNLMRTLADQALVSLGNAPLGQTLQTVGTAALRSENWVVARRVMISGGFRF